MPPVWGFKPLIAGTLLLILSPIFLMKSFWSGEGGYLGTHRLGRGVDGRKSIPWVPKTDGAPSDPAHVRVVIRTQAREELQLRSLIYSLRAQGQRKKGVQVDFVLVPTEPASLHVYQHLRDEMNVGFNDLLLLELPDSFYAIAKTNQGPYSCTEPVRTAYTKKFKSEEVHRYCDFDHYVYYAATDQALLDFVVPCSSCTHVLVTNGDNGYAPSFLEETRRQLTDLAIVAFIHVNRPQIPAIRIGGLDLGAVLMRVNVLDEGRKVFLTSLPVGAGPKEVHDADYWMVSNALDRGFSFSVLKDEVLMYHH